MGKFYLFNIVRIQTFMKYVMCIRDSYIKWILKLNKREKGGNRKSV